MKRAFLVAVGMAGLVATGRLWAAAPACRYTIGADTVLDNVTGLTWQRNAPSTLCTQADAITYCQGLSLGGFSSGWRLPGKKELESLVDFGASPTIDKTAFPNARFDFWTATPVHGRPSKGWFVDFDFGESMFTGNDSSFYARCVR